MPELELLSPNTSFDEEGKQYAWDATSLKLADECLAKYQFKMIEGWQRRGRNVHLEFGGHFATAMEHYYKWRAFGRTSEEALSSVVREALIDTWEYEWTTEVPAAITGFLTKDINGVEHFSTGGKPIEWIHASKTRENLIRTIIWYVDQFENETITVVELSSGKPAVEYSFSLPVDNGLVFTGHIDRLVEYSGEIYAMDQKTTGSTISQNFFTGFSPDHQMSMYTFAGQMVYGSPVKGVIIDGAQIAVGFTRFERGFTFRTTAQLSEWYEDALAVADRARKAVETRRFPRNPTACGNYGGCEFRAVCSRSPDVRPNFLAADFIRGPRWDPLLRR